VHLKIWASSLQTFGPKTNVCAVISDVQNGAGAADVIVVNTQVALIAYQ